MEHGLLHRSTAWENYFFLPLLDEPLPRAPGWGGPGQRLPERSVIRSGRGEAVRGRGLGRGRALEGGSGGRDVGVPGVRAAASARRGRGGSRGPTP